MRLSRWAPALAGALALSAAAAAVASAHPRISTTITWSREISRIVERRCARCHRPEGEAPMSLLTWAEARPWAKAIKEETLARRMPPWPAVRGYGAFANDPSLSPFEIDLIAAWVDGGAPRGHDQDLPPERTSGFGPRASAPDLGPGASASEPAGARTLVAGCGLTPLPPGASIVALRPEGETASASIGIALQPRRGTPEILALIRKHDPKLRHTYELAIPPAVPRGARLHVVSTSAPCRIVVMLAVPHQAPAQSR